MLCVVVGDVNFEKPCACLAVAEPIVCQSGWGLVEYLSARGVVGALRRVVIWTREGTAATMDKLAQAGVELEAVRWG